MSRILKSESFEIEYKETEIKSDLLWESHCHAKYEIITVLEGDISILLEGIGYRLKAGQSAIVPPLCYHTIIANKGGQYKRITVLFELDAVPAPLRGHLSGKDIPLTVFASSVSDELQTICRKSADGYYTPLAESLIVHMLYEYADADHAPIAPVADKEIAMMLKYIDEHLSDKIYLDDLATYTACSKSTVCHVFREKMKISPKQYILRKKLALADKMISEGVAPTIAAIRIGYDNYSDFYRVYRKLYNRSPKSGAE